jgi:hypothetical protein
LDLRLSPFLSLPRLLLLPLLGGPVQRAFPLRPLLLLPPLLLQLFLVAALLVFELAASVAVELLDPTCPFLRPVEDRAARHVIVLAFLQLLPFLPRLPLFDLN